MMFFLHWLGFHQWTKWGEPIEAEVVVLGITGISVVQYRTCTYCNKSSVSSIRM